MNATTSGLPRTEEALTGSPSWLESAKSGSLAPGGRRAPCQPDGTGSSPAFASHTPNTAPAAQRTSVVSASATRDGTPFRLRRASRASRFGQPAPDRVADQLDAIAHAA